MDQLRVVLADDHLLIRQGVAALLHSIDGVSVVAEVEDYDALLEAVADHQPNAVVTDIRMPPTHSDEGIRAALRIRNDHPHIGVVVLSQFAEPSFVLSLFEDGSSGLGYLLKDRVDKVELERALLSVVRDESAVDTKIVDVLVEARSRTDSTVGALTPREQEVLAAIAEGLNNAAVAEALVIGEKAVAKHINSIFSKLGLAGGDDSHRRVKAVLIWLAQ